ncbi:MAG: type II/IV secretion system ATPase subunit [Thermoplasmata archaeon]|nr:type II/IV secretion system ATPase subunit [Thermoplasmata archaeon]
MAEAVAPSEEKMRENGGIEELPQEAVLTNEDKKKKRKEEKAREDSFFIKAMAGYMRFLLKIKKKPLSKKIPIRGAGESYSEGGSIYTTIPPLRDKDLEQVGFYAVREPFSFVRVVLNTSNNEYLLETIEPQLSAKEVRLLKTVKSSLDKTLSYEWDKLTAIDKQSYLEKSVESFLRTRGLKLDRITREKIRYYIVRDFVGYGPIDALMNDTHIEDISCDGINVPLFVYHSKFESLKVNTAFEDEESLNSFVVGLSQRCGKQISVSNPILDGTAPEGHRIQATYSKEVTTRGSTFTIRRFKEKPFTPVDLIKNNTANAEMVAYMWLAVEHGESAIIAGGTASGKTATLNATALFIPPTAKIVTMEDTREINLPHENWIPGATRSGVGERGIDGKSAGEIDMYDLVRAALRQRPNYIIVGEVRGKETYTMFQAMATGHTTYSTMHADSVKGMVNRLENPPINCPRILLTALRNVIIQIHARVGMDMVRRIKQLIEIVGFEPETNELITNTVYEWDQGKDKFIFKGHSFLFDKIMEMKNMTHEAMIEEFNRRVDIIKYMVAKDLDDHKEIWKLIRSYYRDPMATTTLARADLQAMGVTISDDNKWQGV